MGKRSCKNSTRWLDMRWFFVKDAIFREKINLLRVDTMHNVARSWVLMLSVKITMGFAAFGRFNAVAIFISHWASLLRQGRNLQGEDKSATC
jgi:hypothetical protein